MARISPRKVCKFAIPCCILLLFARSWTSKGDGWGTDWRHSHCSRVFRVSDSRLSWESAADVPGSCRSSALDGTSLPRCLEHRREATGRRALLLFIGDSRARILFERLREQLDLQWEGRSVQEVFAAEMSLPNVTVKVLGAPELCVAGHTVGFYPEDRTLLVACDSSASNQLLRAQFFWHPHVDAGYLSRLSAVAAACGRGAACPDLVVLTTGMWYAKPFEERAEHVPLPRRVLELRRDSAALAERLRPLAAHSQLLYRLDGPEMTENHGYKSRIGGVIAAINAVAFGIIKKVGGSAQVWTSNLADSLRFYHTECLPLTRQPASAGNTKHHQCQDPNHVGGTVRRNAVDMLLSFVCRDSEPRQPGHCCGTATVTERRL